MKFKNIFVFILISCLFVSGCDYSSNEQSVHSNSLITYNQTEKPTTDDAKYSSVSPDSTTTHEHSFAPATCTKPQTCTVCGFASGSVIVHSFKNGKCSFCGIKDPNHASEITVWIPTNGGTKYHARSSCSNMKNPQEVTLSKAQNLGYTACKKCY